MPRACGHLGQTLGAAPALAALGPALFAAAAATGRVLGQGVALSLAGRHAGAAARASAVSIVTTIAYLGFLVGPAAVGVAADALSLPMALGAVAGLALLLAALVRLAPAR